MIQAYCDLFELGFAKSIEVWRNNELVGGFYGVDLNNGVFCGESMFSKVSNASKVGFVKFILSTAGAGPGTMIFRISLNLSIAVPMSVADVKSEKSPSV